MNDYIFIECPHCKEYIFVLCSEMNCKIFRHGVYKSSYEQIDPHMKKDECDRLKKEDLIFGCGKPFKIDHVGLGLGLVWIAQICDYI